MPTVDILDGLTSWEQFLLFIMTSLLSHKSPFFKKKNSIKHLNQESKIPNEIQHSNKNWQRFLFFYKKKKQTFLRSDNDTSAYPCKNTNQPIGLWLK